VDDGELEAGDLGLEAVAYLLHVLGLLRLLARGGLRPFILLPQNGPGLGDAGQEEIGVRIALALALLFVFLYHAQAFLGLLGLFGVGVVGFLDT
jgi:hypothetical protein